MSLFFYSWGEPRFVVVMIGSILFNYFMAMMTDAFREKKAEDKKTEEVTASLLRH